MANRHRGEVEVALGGRRYAMRPTFAALCEIEDRTGLGLVELARRFWEGRFGVRELATVLWAGIRAAEDDAPDFETVGGLVAAQGFQSLAGPAAAFLAGVIGGEDDAAAEPAPKKKPKTTPPPSPGRG